MTKTLLIDFDGVIHSYTSRFTSPEEILDGPVEGAIEALERYTDHFDVYIFSTRCQYDKAIDAMRKWLLKHGLSEITLGHVFFTCEKIPAWVMLDDRAITFKGDFPTPQEIQTFKPWNK